MTGDCNFSFSDDTWQDLYESLVNALSRAAQGVHISNTGLTPSQENKVPCTALSLILEQSLTTTHFISW